MERPQLAVSGSQDRWILQPPRAPTERLQPRASNLGKIGAFRFYLAEILHVEQRSDRDFYLYSRVNPVPAGEGGAL